MVLVGGTSSINQYHTTVAFHPDTNDTAERKLAFTGCASTMRVGPAPLLALEVRAPTRVQTAQGWSLEGDHLTRRDTSLHAWACSTMSAILVPREPI